MAKLFGKWDYDGVEFSDKSIEQVVSLRPLTVPHSFGRHAKRGLQKLKVNIVERLINKLMRGGTGAKVGGKVIRTHGRLQGKKLRMTKVVEETFDKIQLRTKKNPIQILVNAIENAAPREGVTRVQMGGVSYQLSVDLSASRRIDIALRNIALSALMKNFDKPGSLSDTLADEIIAAAENDVHNSYAIKRKDEMERMAKAAR